MYKHKKFMSKAFVICFISVFALGLVGICYGAWADNILIDLSLSMGSVKPEYELVETTITNNDGNDGVLKLSLSPDHTSLYIDGWCYPEFAADIPVRIKNNGSLLVKPYIQEAVKEENINIDPIEQQVNAVVYTKIKNLPERIEGGEDCEIIIEFRVDDLISNSIMQILEQGIEDQNNTNHSGNDYQEFDIQSLIENLIQDEEHSFEYRLQFEPLY